MSAIINAIFGIHPKEEQDTTNTTDTTQTVAPQNVTSTECLHTSAVADGVQVKSVISSETQATATLNTKSTIDALLAQLNTTHAEVDRYSRTRTAEINEQVQKSIAAVLEYTQRQQKDLLADANERYLIMDNEYKIQLQNTIEILDTVKAKALADLERDLQEKQQVIMIQAKQQIDFFNDQANIAKLNVLMEAQEQAKENIDNLANQVGAIGQQETENLLQSKTTTIITSQAQANETTTTAPVTETNEQQITATVEATSVGSVLTTAPVEPLVETNIVKTEVKSL